MKRVNLEAMHPFVKNKIKQSSEITSGLFNWVKKEVKVPKFLSLFFLVETLLSNTSKQSPPNKTKDIQAYLGALREKFSPGNPSIRFQLPLLAPSQQSATGLGFFRIRS